MTDCKLESPRPGDTFSAGMRAPVFSRSEKLLFRSQNPSHQVFIRVLKEHLKKNITDPKSMVTTAEKMCISPRTLSRRLRDMDRQYRDLRSEVMQEVAAHQLAHSSHTMQCIARQLGYDNASNFCKAFKRWTGITPGKFRQQQKSVAQTH